MRVLKQEIYFPIVIGIHFLFWFIDLQFYNNSAFEGGASTMFFGKLDGTLINPHRLLGEIFSSWVVTVFAFNFLMATRAKWVERIFGGLDKMYLIHRRSGIIAVFLLLAHFFVVPRAVEFNPGKPLGFYALILILIGVLLSAAPVFKKKIPYHKWINIHKLMGIFYVLGVVHGFMVDSLIKELPITRVYVFSMSIIGVAAWFYKAFLYKLFNRSLSYKIREVNTIQDDVTEIIMQSEGREKLSFKAGQFAFFTFPSISKREQHPFTISSSPSDNDLRITIKGLGDYTNDIGQKLKIGDTALVEGPFGMFSTAYAKEKPQVWIAGGIGITPFLSLSKEMYMQKVALYWCINKPEEAYYKSHFETIAKSNPNFEFIIWPSSINGHIGIEDLGVNDFSNHAYYICGPEALKKNLFKGLSVKGVKSQDIYDEEFSFR